MMTEGEKHLCEFEYGMSGSFYTHLFSAIMKADNYNMTRLSLAFPEEVQAVNCFRNVNGYWDNLQKEYRNDNSK